MLLEKATMQLLVSLGMTCQGHKITEDSTPTEGKTLKDPQVFNGNELNFDATLCQHDLEYDKHFAELGMFFFCIHKTLKESKFKVQSSKFKVQSAKCKVQSSKFKVQRFKVQTFKRSSVQSSKLKVQSFKVQSSNVQVSKLQSFKFQGFKTMQLLILLGLAQADSQGQSDYKLASSLYLGRRDQLFP
jgi:hypothetical protein